MFAIKCVYLCDYILYERKKNTTVNNAVACRRLTNAVAQIEDFEVSFLNGIINFFYEKYDLRNIFCLIITIL